MKRERRTVVLDAQNICYSYLCSLLNISSLTEEQKRGMPPLKALELVISFFYRFDNVQNLIKFVAICPNWWKPAVKKGENEHYFNRLKEHRILHFACPKEHDDFYIISYSVMKDAFFVSNDQYRSHSNDDKDADWIKKRRIGFIFIEDDFVPSPTSISRLESSLEEIEQNLARADEVMDVEEGSYFTQTEQKDQTNSNEVVMSMNSQEQHHEIAQTKNYSNLAAPDRLLF
eukprot:snap_masked-scaffold_9-processed-gene-1.13-mRNA-1 protein AED:1.00 eAED:1.00 QI:0/-1/0/0/-1/1/1/0/229